MMTEYVLKQAETRGSEAQQNEMERLIKTIKSENLNKTKRNRSGVCGTCVDQRRTLIEHTLMLKRATDHKAEEGE